MRYLAALLLLVVVPLALVGLLHNFQSAGADPTPLTVTATPPIFDPQTGYEVTTSGGTAPYTCTNPGSPPNPTGVVISPNGSGGWIVTCPAETEPGTRVSVRVQDADMTIKYASAKTK